MKFLIILLLFLLRINSTEKNKKDPLPFPIDESKKMSDEELSEKKENSFVTGLPSLSSDPITGLWLGGSGYFIENGKKENPLFAYTPYVYRMSVDVYQSSKSAKFYGAGIDIPYIKNTPYRVLLYAYYDRNLTTQYFGVGEETLKPLTYYPRNDDSQNLVNNADFSEREEALSYRRRNRSGSIFPIITDRFYNQYKFEQTHFLSSIDRIFLGKFRIAFGVDFNKTIIKTYDGVWSKAKDPFFGETDFKELNVVVPTPNGKTKVTEDQEAGRITGVKGGYLNILKFGLAYDTRDYEPNPKKGTFAEINYINVSKIFGSDYDFQRIFFHIKQFIPILPKYFKEFIFATRFGLTEVKGNIPFYQYRSLWSIDGGGLLVLGGDSTVKGYKQDRFVGAVTGFGNLELRYRFANFKIGEESFSLQFVPGFTLGRVWDRAERVNLQGYKYSYETGIRIIWNQSTIISIDYARSREDQQFFLNLDQNF
jgi:hypothetical protein